MAVTKGNGFRFWAQPAHLRFVSVPHSIPLRVAHPPLWSCACESASTRVGTRLHRRRVSRRSYQLPNGGLAAVSDGGDCNAKSTSL
jgi:hypothetical protein